MRIETQLGIDGEIMHFFPDVELAYCEYAETINAEISALAKNILAIDGVAAVLITPDCLSAAKRDFAVWEDLKPQLLAEIADAFAEGTITATKRQRPEQLIAGLIKLRIRPAIRKDGGDIVFHGFENGVVYVELCGKCVGCPHSQRTLKDGVERLLKSYVPEVLAVEKASGGL